MTRVTSFGRKRTYLQAGFDNNAASGPLSASQHLATPGPSSHHTQTEEADPTEPLKPPKKKRKRTPKSKRDGHAAEKLAAAIAEGKIAEGDSPTSTNGNSPTAGQPTTDPSEPPKMTNKRRKLEEFRARRARKQAVEAAARQTPAERRRLKRIEEKLAATTCFACRQTGHAARDCPSAASAGREGQSKVVGVCYRCGSQRHSLSRCKKPENAQDPYPFASCFVCNGKGHLASACPQNAAKGIYPNGGCCKLCNETTHLAKDCRLKKTALENPTTLVGTGRGTGADEDDFHAIKRQTGALDREEKRHEKIQTQVARGVVPSVKTSTKKVVVF